MSELLITTVEITEALNSFKVSREKQGDLTQVCVCLEI